MWKAWHQEHEVTGHILPTVVKQRENDASTQFASFFLFSPGLKFIVWNHPYPGPVFSHQSKLSGNVLIFIHRNNIS